MPKITINKKLKRLEVSGFELDNDVVFEYFDRMPATEREELFFRAIYIGVLALMEDRLAAFLSKTTNELGTELESLKRIFDMKHEVFYKTAVKGALAEEEIAEYMNKMFLDNGLKDVAHLTGAVAGVIPKNKTGDIVCSVDGDDSVKIVIECKFDKNVKYGEIEKKDIFTRKMDTAWSQLIEAQANRDGRVGIIVFDSSLVDGSIVKNVGNIKYIKQIGFVSIINSQKGDFSNLAIAYMLARDIALNAKVPELDKELLGMMVGRLIGDMDSVLSIKKLVEGNIENNKEILRNMEKSILLLEFHKKYFAKFLAEGTLTKVDLLQFYYGGDVPERYKAIEREILEAYQQG